MGGQIGVASKEGQGSTFWFTAVFEKQLEGRHGDVVIPEDIRGKRILVVDDSAANRQVSKEQLSLWDCEFDEASSGTEALDKLRDAVTTGKPFDIAVIDMGMPVMEGEALGRRIKEAPDIRDTRLVMLTSMGQRGDAVRVEEFGIAGYLTKPVKPSQLHECLAAVAGRQKGAEEELSEPIVTRHSIAEDRKSKIRILVAEDDSTNQMVALKILKNLGFRADTVDNGQDAVNALETTPYDLVLMDVQMPEMNGLEATRVIRDPESPIRNHEVPIVALTAHAMNEHREQCLEAGMDDFVTKPVNPRELGDAIERHLSDSPQAVEPDLFAAAPSVEGKSFDRSALLERLSGDEELLNEVLELFIKDIPSQLEELNQALNDNAAGEVRQRGHRIKGTAANVSAEAMREIAFAVEKAGEAGALDRAIPLVKMLEQEFEKLKHQISPGQHYG